MTPPTPFRTVNELRTAHEALVGRLEDAVLAQPGEPSESVAVRQIEAEVRAFIGRAVATGVCVDLLEDRTACQVLIDYWATKLARATSGHELPLLAPFDEAANPELPDDRCPFVGARAYEGGQLFEGRRAETEQLVQLIEAHPLVVVTGPAGCGKSSLVMAGALPRLRDRLAADGRPRWRVLPALRPGPQLPAQLQQGLGAGAAPPVVITLDQAEQLLAPELAAAARPALAALVALLRANAGHRVVLIVREESEARLLAWPALAAWAGASGEGPRLARLSVQPLTPEQLREAIVGPAEAVGLQLHPEVVDDLVNRLAGQRAALPLLQHALMRLWQVRRRNRVTWDDYLKIGDALEAEKWRLEAVFQTAAVEAKDRLVRRERRLLRWTWVALAGLAIVTSGLSWWAGTLAFGKAQLESDVEKNSRVVGRMTQAYEESERARAALEQQLRTMAPTSSPVAAAAPAVAASMPHRPPGEQVAAPTGAPPKPGAAAPATAVATAGAPLAPAPAGMAAPPPAPAASVAVAEPAAGVASAASATAAAPAAAASAAPSATEAWLAALGRLDMGERHSRARRLVYWIDQGRTARRIQDLRRLHPISWSWAQPRWEELQLQSPLSLAILFDTAVAHGPLQAAMMRARADPSNGTLESERAIISSLLDRREALKGSALTPEDEPRRIAELRKLLKQEDWLLQDHAAWGR